MLEIEKSYPLNTSPVTDLNYNCWCLYSDKNPLSLQQTKPNSTALEYCLSTNGTLSGQGCATPNYKSDVFLFSIILFAATYLLSTTFKSFRTKPYLPTKYRNIISDFAVPIAIIAVTVFDNWLGLDTPKLIVPNDFKVFHIFCSFFSSSNQRWPQPTSSERGWLIAPFVDENPMWLSLVAVVPALLATILVFMDQQITAVIVNRKENKLKVRY